MTKLTQIVSLSGLAIIAVCFSAAPFVSAQEQELSRAFQEALKKPQDAGQDVKPIAVPAAKVEEDVRLSISKEATARKFDAATPCAKVEPETLNGVWRLVARVGAGSPGLYRPLGFPEGGRLELSTKKRESEERHYASPRQTPFGTAGGVQVTKRTITRLASATVELPYRNSWKLASRDRKEVINPAAYDNGHYKVEYQVPFKLSYTLSTDVRSEIEGTIAFTDEGAGFRRPSYPADVFMIWGLSSFSERSSVKYGVDGVKVEGANSKNSNWRPHKPEDEARARVHRNEAVALECRWIAASGADKELLLLKGAVMEGASEAYFGLVR